MLSENPKIRCSSRQGTLDSISLGGLSSAFVWVIICFYCFFLGYLFLPKDLSSYCLGTSFDGYEWLTDSLLFDYGLEANSTLRCPGLPLVLATLRALQIDRFFPLFCSALLFSFLIGAYHLVRIFVGQVTALLTIFCLLSMARLTSFFFFILADAWAITFLTIGIAFLLSPKLGRNRAVLSGSSLGVSWCFQYAVGILAPALILFISIRFVKEPKERRNLVLVPLIASLFFFLEQGWRFSHCGSFFCSRLVQFPLLGWHDYGVLFYLLNGTAFIGLPFLFLVLFGGISALGAKAREEWFIMISFCSFLLFWVFFYRWLEVRFLLYFTPMFGVFLALGLSSLGNICLGWLSRCFLLAYLWLGLVYAGQIPDQPGFPFYSRALPLWPNQMLQFEEQAVDDSSALAIQWSKPKLEKYQGSYWPLYSQAVHILRECPAPATQLDKLREEMKRIEEVLNNSKNNSPLAVRGELDRNYDFWYFAKWRREHYPEHFTSGFHPYWLFVLRNQIIYNLKREIVPCSAPSTYRLHLSADNYRYFRGTLEGSLIQKYLTIHVVSSEQSTSGH